ncbi:MAG: M23 family metallopeptidase [Propionibacteriaceae bacterium]|nr:M23 family metallopeptidase [Propionibacteriaceae bacterium]
MYQPRRASSDATSRAAVDAFHRAPRRAVRGRMHVMSTRIAPAAVSVTMLATASGVAVALNTQETTGVPAPVRVDDAPSRNFERSAEGLAADQAAGEADAEQAADEVPETPAPTPTPEPTANAAFVGGTFAEAFGTVTGKKYAQQDVTVRAQADKAAESLGTVKEGEQVTVTDKVVGSYVQVALDGKVGYVPAKQLGTKPPAKEEVEVVGMAEVGDAVVSDISSGGTLFFPTAGKIGSPWGMRKHPILGYTRLHGGVDIGGRTGQPIYAAEDGVVTKAAYGHNSGSGNNVRIKHGKVNGKNLETAYLHMTKLSVKAGQKVKRGQVIGTVGSTGLSTSPHLHFSVYVNGANSNPAPWLR